MAGGTSWTPDSILDIQDQNRSLANRLLDSLPTEQPLEGGWWTNNGSLTRSAATPPTITLQPESVSVLEEQPATFVVEADNAASYQWRRDGVVISGATGASYKITETSLSDNGAEFDCVVTGLGGVVVSDTATLTVSVYDFAALFANGENGGFWLPSDAATLFTDSAGTTLANDGDRVGQIADKSGNGRHAVQAASGSRPTLAGRKLSFIQGQSIVAPFAESLGSSCTVAVAIPGVGAYILTGQSVGSTYTIYGEMAGLLIINRDLDTSEIDGLRTYFNALSTLGGTVGLLDNLVDSPHTVGFVELWAVNDGNGVNNSAPTNPAIPKGDTHDDIIFEHTVSGSAGDSALTISAGDESLFGSTYGVVIQHDDDSWGRYQVLSMGSGSCAIFPRLKATTTSKTMRNSGSAENGQHDTRPGYKQMAWEIMRRTKGEAYRGRHLFTWRSFDGKRAAWTPINITSAQYIVRTTNVFTSSSSEIPQAWLAKGRVNMWFQSAQRPYTGRGGSMTIPLGGETGFIEFFASAGLDSTPSGQRPFVAFRAEVIIDGEAAYDETFDDYSGLQHIIVPFDGAESAMVRVRRTADEDLHAGILVDRVTAWAYDREDDWDSPLVDINAKTVVIGDSWTTWADDTLPLEIQSIVTSRGGTGEVVGVGLGGMTAEWGVENFDARVPQHSPDQVIILFFTNDKNQWGALNWHRWLGALYEIGRKCQAIGARPIFVNPAPTQSLAQSVDHGTWATRIGLGLPLE